MSKKAKEVVEAEPKFAQPWQGFLSMFAVIILAYVAYEWFFNPIWGWLTKMVQANAFVLYEYFSTAYPGTPYSSLAFVFALNNPQELALYPQGYLVNWAAYFILCIVWFISFAVLARPFTPSKSRIGKQPWAGLIILVLTMIIAFLTWYILIIVLKMTAIDVIMLGTIGFWIFPIWATLFSYWPFIPRRPGTHMVIRGAIFVTISWVVAWIIRYIAIGKIAPGSMQTVYSQEFLFANGYFGGLTNPLMVYGYSLTTITPTAPWDFVNSLFFALIVANTLWSVLAPWPNMTQPKRGLFTFILAIITGLILWGILFYAIAPSTTGIVLPTAIPGYITIYPVTYYNYANITALLTFPLVTLLFGQLTFAMWPWSRWGMKGHFTFVILAFIIGIILYYILMVNPGFAGALTSGNQISTASGMQSLALYFEVNGTLGGVTPALVWDAWVFLVAFEGVDASTSVSLMYTWTVTVVIFFLLAYEGFDHWPFK